MVGRVHKVTLDHNGRSQISDQSSRSLRVFLVSSGRMRGSLGDPKSGSPWVGSLLWSNKLSRVQSETLRSRSMIGSDEFPAGAWLNAFEDRSTPRIGTDDVIFSTSTNQTPVEPKPIIHIIDNRIFVPIDEIVLGLAAGIWLISFVISRRKNEHGSHRGR